MCAPEGPWKCQNGCTSISPLARERGGYTKRGSIGRLPLEPPPFQRGGGSGKGAPRPPPPPPGAFQFSPSPTTSRTRRAGRGQVAVFWSPGLWMEYTGEGVGGGTGRSLLRRAVYPPKTLIRFIPVTWSPGCTWKGPCPDPEHRPRGHGPTPPPIVTVALWRVA